MKTDYLLVLRESLELPRCGRTMRHIRRYELDTPRQEQE